MWREKTDQTARMSRLIWVFAGRKCHFVGFVMRRLKWCINDNLCRPVLDTLLFAECNTWSGYTLPASPFHGMLGNNRLIGPTHEIMVLLVLRKLILQTRMCGHPVGQMSNFWSDPSSTSILNVCKQRKQAHLSSLVTYVINTIISWAGSIYKITLSKKFSIIFDLKITYRKSRMQKVVDFTFIVEIQG